MPIPIPLPNPLTVPPPLSAPPSTKQTYWLSQDQSWAENQVATDHQDALYHFGEYAIFVLMWHSQDYDAGLVGLCTVCMTLSTSRVAAAYQQAPQEKCLGCFGTTFEGGYRARIVRPSIWTDRTTDMDETARGTVLTDTMTVETTGDFTLRHRDYVLRADGTRYSAEQKGEIVVRSGFQMPPLSQSIGGLVSSVRFEDQSSVAYLIPPTPSAVTSILQTTMVGHQTPPDFSAFEVTNRGPLLVP